MTKEKRNKKRDSPERESKIKIKQERESPVRPHKTRRSRSRSNGNSSPQRTSRTRDRSSGRRGTPPTGRGSRSPRNRRSRSPHRPADVRVKRVIMFATIIDDDRGRDRDRRRERNALASQEAERQQHDERRRENRQQREENEEQNFGSTDDPPVEKEKPNFGLSGALTEDTNTFRGVVIKYNEPPEARIPKRRWRLYPFKNDEALPVMYIHRQSAYLLVFQYRLVEITRADGTSGRRVKPYIIDLGSGNGTYLNNQRIDPQRYYELKEKDVLKFGFSSREYVLLHEFSDTTEVDAKREEDDEGLDE
uniref:FHA domain-containing protein n=1 Tax=Takifugu rubripes TaxID=31033 RepID=H2TBR1_TAKRU